MTNRRKELELLEIEAIVERTTTECYYIHTDESQMFIKKPIRLPKSLVRVVKVTGEKNNGYPITTLEIPEWLAVDRELV